MIHARRPVYVISIAASLAGCHPRTLRIYEDEGLVDPVRTETNIRLYSDEDVHKVRCIRYLTQVRRVNLAGVKLLLQFRDAGDLLREIADAIETMDEVDDERDDHRSRADGADRERAENRAENGGAMRAAGRIPHPAAALSPTDLTERQEQERRPR